MHAREDFQALRRLGMSGAPRIRLEQLDKCGHDALVHHDRRSFRLRARTRKQLERGHVLCSRVFAKLFDGAAQDGARLRLFGEPADQVRGSQYQVIARGQTAIRAPAEDGGERGARADGLAVGGRAVVGEELHDGDREEEAGVRRPRLEKGGQAGQEAGVEDRVAVGVNGCDDKVLERDEEGRNSHVGAPLEGVDEGAERAEAVRDRQAICVVEQPGKTRCCQ